MPDARDLAAARRDDFFARYEAERRLVEREARERARRGYLASLAARRSSYGPRDGATTADVLLAVLVALAVVSGVLSLRYGIG